MRYSEHPYGSRRRWRERLPWFPINLGLADKGADCEIVNAKHHWYNMNNEQSACYFCEVVQKGKLWNTTVRINIE